MLKVLFFSSLFFIVSSCSTSTEPSYAKKVLAHREFTQVSFQGSNSPLKQKDKDNFKGLNYYNVDSSYKVKAFISWDLNCLPIRLVTDTAIKSLHFPTAALTFKINGKPYSLQGFSRSLKDIKEIFIPFYDKTSGKETYGGGRFLDAEIVSNEQVILDFNYAYNPYCAYNSNYICAVPPFSNDLKVEILAGEKLPLIDKH